MVAALDLPVPVRVVVSPRGILGSAPRMSITTSAPVIPRDGEGRLLDGLLLKVASGDRGAFRALYEETSGRLFAVCLRILRDRRLAEDVVQEAYIRIWERARQYDPGVGSARAWVNSVARNHAIDVIRSRGRDTQMADADAIEIADTSSLRAAEAAIEASALWRCLNGLEEKTRQAIVLAYRDGFTYDELSAMLGVPSGTLKTWVRRSLPRLRGCMDNDDA
jgi:RNA polymerase sigma factor (sigma-70 family)